ncbi:cysteine synthase family protein [Demequina capsici]|uniref:Cysteine synthase family protein n=1 Tax=Demequina capsici TaxID=3075620 RepID=A0AA96FF52_9MICO|nr:cysteine synthase family protein [Demequina sp. PMTSA13]WNM28495.1 cysteine synthase family protein [Demequina sp. PMTSA13]
MAGSSMPRTGDHSILTAIGGTPLIRLGGIVPDGAAEVWVKLEGGNPTGSYKDRMALSVIRAALERGDVRQGDTLVEFTGGSTGMSLALVAGVLGLKFTAVFSDAFSHSKQQAMEAFGATVVVEHSDDGLITTALAERMRERAHDLAAQPGHHYVDQFGSPDVPPGYVPMGTEIATSLGGEFDVFCHGVGTGGALMGALDGMRAAGASPQVVALEPTQAPLLSEGRSGAHSVEGIAVFTDPAFLDRSRLDDVRVIDQNRAFDTCRRLACSEGVFAGASTGLNVAAAIELAEQLGSGHRVVTIACDTGLKYLGEQPYV